MIISTIEPTKKSLELAIHQLKQALAQSQQQLAHSQQQFTQSQQQLAEEKAKNAFLLEQFRLAKQRAFAPSSEKDPLQADLFDETGLDTSTHQTPEKTLDVKSHQRKKHGVRKPIPDYLPREVVMHDISQEEKTCVCGSELVKMGEEITEQYKFIPASLTVLRHVRPQYACKPCQGGVKIAPQPLFLLPKTNATPELVAHTLIAKYADHIPLYRQAKIWNRVDIDLPRSTLCSWLNSTGDLCVPLLDLLQEAIISEDYTQADESPVQVLQEPGRKNTTSSYLWVYKGGGARPSIVFDYQQTRGGCHAQAFLGDFSGYLQTDAYAGYHFTEKRAGIIPVGCMAHARRPFEQLAKLAQKEGLATQALAYFKALYAIETTAREMKMTAQERYHLRLEKAPPILAALKGWLETHITKVPKQHQLGKAMYYVLNNWNVLNQYLSDGRLEIDNNGIENTIRPLALGRKNWLFMGSPRGAKTGAIFYSLIATCIANQVDPYRYFTSMLHKIRHCKTKDDYRALLPQFITLD